MPMICLAYLLRIDTRCEISKQIKQAMDRLGIENVYVHTDAAQGRNLQQEMFDFFLKAFKRP
jgi:hypothetical protein